jgi:predicted negative regulator of RcsB-dependent stress response
MMLKFLVIWFILQVAFLFGWKWVWDGIKRMEGED